MKYEQLLAQMDGFSRYTLWSCLTIGLMAALICMENFANNFISPALSHWCYVPSLVDLPQDTQRYLVVTDDEQESCRTYDIPWQNYSHEQLTSWNWSAVDVSDYQQITCEDGWVYDNSTFTHATATSEWDLVCEKEIILDLLSPIYLVGLLFGSLSSGPFSDRFGRLRSMLIYLVVYLLAGLATVFAPNVWVYMLGRHLIALTIRGANIGGIVLLAEVTIPKFRGSVFVAHRMFYVSGMIISSIVGYFLRHFRVYQLALVVPVIPLLPILLWVFPESPRWLYSKNRTEDTKAAIKKLARRYRRTIPDEMIDEYAEQKVESVESSVTGKEVKTRTWDMFSHPVIRRYTLIIGYCKVAAQFVYFAVSMNMGALVGDLYLNTLIAGSVEIPSLLIVLWALPRFGRQVTVASAFLVAATTGAISTAFLVVGGADMGSTVTLLICRSAVGCAMSALTTYTGELFPTPFRQSAVGFTSAMASMVSIFSPMVGGPLMEVWAALPNIIFTVLVSLAALLVFLLPETLNQPLPDTTQDAVDLMKNGGCKGSSCLPCYHTPKETTYDTPGTPDKIKSKLERENVFVVSHDNLRKATVIGCLSDEERIGAPPVVSAENYLSLGKAGVCLQNDVTGHINNAYSHDLPCDYFSTKL